MAALAVGQKWMTRNGIVVTIKCLNFGSEHEFECESDESKACFTVDQQGRYYGSSRPSDLDLIELLDREGWIAPPDTANDAEALAAETLLALGYYFDGQAWVQEVKVDAGPVDHPLYPVFLKAIHQAMYGKGERHGGAASPFMDQPWVHYVKMHGRGFLTGQAAKKLEEAASTRSGEAFETEVLGALVYIGMAVLHERSKS